MATLKYKRILYKISGEVLAGDKGFGLDFQTIHKIAQEIIDIHALGAEVGIVLGGGNIFRGSTGAEGGIDRVTGDYMGMLATVINALSLQDALEKKGIYTRVLTAIRMEAIAEPYIRRRALRHLEKGRVVIIAAGTGNPYFTTDTAAALRAVEIEAQVLLKGTKVDGIYDKDPMLNDNAVFYEKITYQQVLRDNLKVMDAAAITLCRDNHLPIVVFNLKIPNQISRILQGEPIGTIICEE